MARYIDADKLKEHIKNYGNGAIADGHYALDPVDDIVAIAGIVDFMPTADVVPKSEVAREIILDVDTLICCHANGDIDDKNLYILFDELKKKYTEGD